MSPAVLLLPWLLVPSQAAVEIVRDGPLLPPHGTPIISNATFEVQLEALLDVEVRGQADRSPGYTIPRARVALDATLETLVPLGMRLELDPSPFADQEDNLNGPGLLRDAYLRIGVGNAKLINLGEIRIGQLRVPSSAHSLRSPQHWHFTRRPYSEQAVLPGRDLGFVYHVDYGRHGVPAQVWIGSFAGVGPNSLEPQLDPLVSTRIESTVLRRPGSVTSVTAGLGVVANSASRDHPLVVLADLDVTLPRVQLEAAWLLVDRLGQRRVERGALRLEAGVEVLSDFLELRIRHEMGTLTSRELSHWLSAVAVLTYLDDVFQVLFELGLPELDRRWLLKPEGAVAFRVWW